jgi:hypothetical protein
VVVKKRDRLRTKLLKIRWVTAWMRSLSLFFTTTQFQCKLILLSNQLINSPPTHFNNPSTINRLASIPYRPTNYPCYSLKNPSKASTTRHALLTEMLRKSRLMRYMWQDLSAAWGGDRPARWSFLALGNGVTVARLTLDQLVGVQIPIPQFS